MSRMRVNTQLLAIHFFVRGKKATIRWKVLLSNLWRSSFMRANMRLLVLNIYRTQNRPDSALKIFILWLSMKVGFRAPVFIRLPMQ